MSIWILLLVILIALAYLTCPCLDRKRTLRWKGQPFAHRGLHDLDAGVVENTLPAFEAARDAGYGMELDIQFSKDMQVVVFHDDDLQRLCGDPRKIWDVPLDELRALTLAGVPGARIPTFREVLDAVGGKAPLLIELKNGPFNRQLCEALVEIIKNYPSEYIVESFNPLIVAWFRRNAPEVVRGQLVDALPSYRPVVNSVAAFCMSGLLFNFLTRPDFVAYNVSALRFFSPHFQRAMFRTTLAAWTVRDPQTAALVKSRGEISIFEAGGRP